MKTSFSLKVLAIILSGVLLIPVLNSCGNRSRVTTLTENVPYYIEDIPVEEIAEIAIREETLPPPVPVIEEEMHRNP